ncbi:MAG: hypothetical protein R3B13_24320 [Polyangiaceae bacterium]
MGKRIWASAIAASVVAAMSVAGAQPAGDGQQVPELNTQQAESLSLEQMKKLVLDYLVAMNQDSSTIRRMLSEAREKRDVVKVLCLDDKLNQADVATRSARDRQPNLDAAAKSGDKDQGKHEFTVIQTLRERVKSLVAEANQCIGEETGFVGDTEVTVDIDPTIPDDPSNFPDDPLISQPPPISSPTL